MNYRFFTGMDVSKEKLDVVMLDIQLPDLVNYFQCENNSKGIATMLKWLSKHKSFDITQNLFCMEHTGIYSYPMLKEASIRSLSIWLEKPLQIKKSLGLQRGKNDKIDAERIARYAMKNLDLLQLWQPPREVIDKIRLLSNQRNNLIITKGKLLTPIEEYKQFGSREMAKMLEKSIAKTIKAIESDIEKIEQQIHDSIGDDDHLKKLFGLITSVVGVGFVTAINLIVHTNEFKILTDARKLACYCGVAPFEHSSGSSIKGRTRVSHLANKKLKTNLHMASLTAVRLDPFIKTYYERKVKEGKNKMSVLNAVRNKLIQRIIAVVKRGVAYQKINPKNDLVLS